MASCSSDWPVHQLWPSSGGKRMSELDVLFFHGLEFTAKDSRDAWFKTWSQRGHDNVCWPREWLPYDLGEAVRIFSVSYNAHIQTSPHDHVSEVAHNLFQTLMSLRYEWHHPIVLIGHSFGGLVLKSLVVKLNRESTIRNPINLLSKATVQRAKEFLRNLKGVAFYAVPHAGSSNIPNYVNRLFRCNNGHYPGLIENIRPCQRDMEQLSVDFGRVVAESEINIYAFCEGRPMAQLGILVDCTSARRLAEDNFYTVEDADHMEVCKPPNKEHPSYGLLLQFIITCRNVEGVCDEAWASMKELHDLPQWTFGLDSYVERLETLVMSSDSDAAAQYVGIWGMGGVGKTLLLQTLHGSLKLHVHFQGAKFIWRTVGQAPDILTLYRSLSEELGVKPELNLNPEDYKSKLNLHFRRKRVFLILDDVWQEEAFDSLDLAKGKGSVTLLSTRNQFVLKRASPHIRQEYMIPLSEEDSWSLFCVHAFRPPSNVPCELTVLAQSMAQECQGLPLALKVIGTAMFGKTLPEWKLLLKKLRESRLRERTVDGKLYERLKLGYDLLSDDDWRLKDCFLYFAAFPEDCRIDFEDVLRHWIGEGLVPGNCEDDPTADAFSLLNMLSRRSFIESIRMRSSFGSMQGVRGWLFKVHDVMRDLAFYIVEKDCGKPPAKELYFYRGYRNLKEVPVECTAMWQVRRISLTNNVFNVLPEFLYAPKLVSLLLDRNPVEFVPGSFFINLPNLGVLDLSYAWFDSLPEELGDLKNLVFLNLSWCSSLQILPDAVGKLHKLKYLLLEFCNKLNYLPSGVGCLTSLQVLNIRSCGKLTWADYTPAGIGRAESNCHAYPAVMHVQPSNIPASLEHLCGLVDLTELLIGGGGEADRVVLPHNISALTNLEDLSLRLKSVKILPAEMSHCFNQLGRLDLWGCKSLEYLPSTFTCCGAFPALLTFQLGECSALVEFPEVYEGAMPKLQDLSFYKCESLEPLPLSLQLLKSLRVLTLIKCSQALQNSCRKCCETSSTWSSIDIVYEEED